MARRQGRAEYSSYCSRKIFFICGDENKYAAGNLLIQFFTCRNSINLCVEFASVCLSPEAGPSERRRNMLRCGRSGSTVAACARPGHTRLGAASQQLLHWTGHCRPRNGQHHASTMPQRAVCCMGSLRRDAATIALAAVLLLASPRDHNQEQLPQLSI